jgi:hypothetical protein
MTPRSSKISMSSRSMAKKPRAASTRSDDVGAPPLIFGAPLIAGEDPSGYEELCARVAAAVRPKDAIEEMLVRDITDNAWEVLRLRRLKAALFASGRRGSLLALLVDAKIPEPRARDLAGRAVSDDGSAVGEVEQALASIGLPLDAIPAHTILVRLRDFETIEGLIAGHEARRHVAVRELERRRSMLATAPWRENEVIEAECEDVGPKGRTKIRPKVGPTRDAPDRRALQSPRRPRRRINER